MQQDGGAAASPDDFASEVLHDKDMRTVFAVHFAMTLVANAIICALAIVLWSSIGFGKNLYEFLFSAQGWAGLFFCLCALVLLVLYIFDFFWPPHLPQVLVLWDQDRFVGRTILVMAGGFFVIGCLLRAQDFPSIPVLITILMCPISVFVPRAIFQPFQPEPVVGEHGIARRKTDIVEHGDVHSKMMLLRSITGEEANTRLFYKACTTTFMTCFVVTLIIWIVFEVVLGDGLDALSAGLEQKEVDIIYVQWAVPLVVAIANLVFGLYTILRVYMQTAYSRTDNHKNALIAFCMDSSMIHDMTNHRLELLKKARNTQIFELEQGDALAQKRQQYLKQHAGHARQLSTIIKVVGCMFILLLSLIYVFNQLLYADHHIASMVIGTMAAFFIIFVIFIYVAFRRIVLSMGKWLVDLPAWQTLKNLTRNEWCIAMCLTPLVPLMPVVLAISMLNQLVRKCRGIYKRPESQGDTGPSTPMTVSERCIDVDPEKLYLTPRVHNRINLLKEWNWLSLILKSYLLCCAFILYTLTPSILNPSLAWMNSAIDESGMPFPAVVALTFLIGVTAFLLPPVPGMTVYLFGGLVISGNSPPKGTDEGFWIGAAVNIAMAFVLKLVACAVQQVAIGGLLGKSMWVRQTIGVHKVFVRCIEAVLRKPGLSVGKVAILCGGPDWPVSVTAGILKLSLFEMELGTLPIIGFIIPCALGGSFYLKKGESEMWANTASLMLVVALMVSCFLLAVATWALQEELEHNREELERPRKENVDLEWIDYRSEQIAKRIDIDWHKVPSVVRVLLVIGVVIHILVCDAFAFGASYIIGDFAVNDPLSELNFLTESDPAQGLFTYAAVALLGIYAASWLLHIQFDIWKYMATSAKIRDAAKDIDQQEADWKQKFLLDAESRVPKEGAGVAVENQETPPAQGGAEDSSGTVSV